MDLSKSLAELVAMRARGELSEEQFEEAKRLLQKDSIKPSATPTPAVAANLSNALKPEKKKSGCRKVAFWLVIIFVVIPLGIAVIGQLMMTPEEKAKQAADRAHQAELQKAQDKQQAEEAKKKLAQQAEEDSQKLKQNSIAEDEKRKAGFHCLSSWDGSDSDLVNAVKAQMREPDSFEHIETKITRSCPMTWCSLYDHGSSRRAG